MFENVPKGLVLKSETCEKGEAFYTIILKNRFIPGINKTVDLYKNWEDDNSRLELSSITNYNFKDYLRRIKNGTLEFAEEEEMDRLDEEIENLPRKARNKIYKKEKLKLINRIEMISDEYFDPALSAAIQKIANINSSQEDLSSKVRNKKKFSVI